MKNQYVFFRVIHIQCAVKPQPLMGGGGGLLGCHNCTITFSEPLVNISDWMWLPFLTFYFIFVILAFLLLFLLSQNNRKQCSMR